MPRFVLLVLAALMTQPGFAQFDEDQLGAWYTLQATVNREGSTIGFQGDIQHRNWEVTGDLEQLLVRGGVTWQPTGSAIKYTFGYAHVTSGTFGPADNYIRESRLYQEALLPQRIGERGFATHRVRFEQRDIQSQDLRTRLRYMIGYNYPFNQATLGQGAIYLALSNEFFLNLEQGIGRNREVDWFDRNRAAAGIGYSLSDTSRLQFSYMHQQLDETAKGQLLLNWIQTF